MSGEGSSYAYACKEHSRHGILKVVVSGGNEWNHAGRGRWIGVVYLVANDGKKLPVLVLGGWSCHGLCLVFPSASCSSCSSSSSSSSSPEL